MSSAPASDSVIRWGILGPGNIARQFATALTESKSSTLYAVASRSLEKARAFASTYKAARAYGNYQELLNDGDVDAVYIATPHPFHARWAIQAARAGKHILCEKPATLNFPETMSVLEEAEINRVFFMEAFMYRCHPQTTRIIDWIREGQIGTVRVIQAQFGFDCGDQPKSRLLDNDLGGGGILDVGCYPMSFVRLVAGAANGQPFSNPCSIKGMGQLHETTGIDTWAAALLTFPSGILAEISTSVQARIGAQARIIGSQGVITVESPWFCKGSVFLERFGKRTIRKKFRHKQHLYRHEIETLAQHLGELHAPSPAMSGDDTAGNMKALDQWRREIGLTYRRETLEGQPATHDGEPLGQCGNLIPRVPFPGLSQPVSKLIMGCLNQKTIPEAIAMFDDFFRKGGNAFDTATSYRDFDKLPSLVGQWMNLRGVREQCLLIDKGARPPFTFPHLLETEMQKALINHGSDYVDIYLMHRDNPDVPAGEFVDALNQMIQKGICRVYGLSNWTLDRWIEAISYAESHHLQPPLCLSNQFSLSRRNPPPWPGTHSCSDNTFRLWLEKNPTPVLPWSSQGGGFFSENSPADKTLNETIARYWHNDDNFERKNRARKLASQYGVSVINIALAYVLHQPFPTFPIIGPQNLKETRTCLPALNVHLSPDEISWLDLRH